MELMRQTMITISDFADRLAKLRLQKGISSREMSLSIGQNESFINKIENKNNFPLMQSFFCICDYLGITPYQFFQFDDECPKHTDELVKDIQKLDYKQTKLIHEVIKEIIQKKKN